MNIARLSKLAPLIPAQAGIQSHNLVVRNMLLWVPACAGTSGCASEARLG
jgi:hypothetical protein